MVYLTWNVSFIPRCINNLWDDFFSYMYEGNSLCLACWSTKHKKMMTNSQHTITTQHANSAKRKEVQSTNT